MWLGLSRCATPASIEPPTQPRHPVLVPFALRRAHLQMPDAGQRAGGDRRRQRGGEDEAGGKAADEIADRGRCRDIAADHAERLRQRAFDHGQAMAHALAVGDAAAVRAVETDAMHLVEIGHGVVGVRDVAEFRDRRDVAIHRIDRLERHQLRRVRIEIAQLAFEIARIVMGEDARLAAAVPDALDHRGVVEFVRQDRAARHPRRQRADRGHVGDIARGEQQRGFLAVQIGEFPLQQHVIVVGAGDVAGAAGAGAATVERLVHRRQHRGVLAHAEIVVGAPHGDLAGAVRMVMPGTGKGAGLALEIGKYAIASFAMKTFKLPAKISLVVHDVLPLIVAAGSVPMLRAVVRSSLACCSRKL